MTANRMFRYLIAAVALWTALGCGPKAPPDYTKWAEDPPPVTLDSSRAFDMYRSAALEAEQKGAKYLTRVSYFPGQKLAAAKLVEEPFKKVIRATASKAEFDFRPHRPFETLEYHKGWRLLGRVFAWKVEDAAKQKDFGTAVQLANTGTKFAFDLTAGGAMDASLGYGIADDIRRVLAPYLDEMEQPHLSALSTGISAALQRLAPPDRVVQNEKQNMLMATQSVQDAFQKSDWKDYEEKMGSSGKDAGEALHNLARENNTERIDFFQSMATEVDRIITYNLAIAALPTEERRSQKAPEFKRSRDWRVFSQHFFETLPPVLAMRDATVARTKLLILTSRLLANRKEGFPSDLPKGSLETDPFSGRPFIYHYDAAQFSLYSVGPNLRDDGGETDETFSKPDLVLEQR